MKKRSSPTVGSMTAGMGAGALATVKPPPFEAADDAPAVAVAETAAAAGVASEKASSNAAHGDAGTTAAVATVVAAAATRVSTRGDAPLDAGWERGRDATAPATPTAAGAAVETGAGADTCGVAKMDVSMMVAWRGGVAGCGRLIGPLIERVTGGVDSAAAAGATDRTATGVLRADCDSG